LSNHGKKVITSLASPGFQPLPKAITSDVLICTIFEHCKDKPGVTPETCFLCKTFEFPSDDTALAALKKYIKSLTW
jgi:hypothetical protein